MNINKDLLAGQGMTSLRTRQRLIERLTEKGISDVRVLEAMRDSPRHLFLDEALSTRAYEDLALPIGYQQTISQPYIVARMTEALIAHDRMKATSRGVAFILSCAIRASVILATI